MIKTLSRRALAVVAFLAPSAIACGSADDGSGSLSAPGNDAGAIALVDAQADAASWNDAAYSDHASSASDAASPSDTGADAPTHTDAAPDAPGDQVARLLQLTQSCTAAQMVSSHVYPDPGSAVPNVPICALKGAVFFNSDMDVDCDGRATPPKCPGPDPSYQPDTAFHNKNDQPLAAAITPYVVLPNDFHYPGLDTTNGGNVIAVIYNHQLKFAVFGDTGPTNLIGEASYACAESLGINPNPASGGIDRGVTYIVFVGANTKPADIEDQAATASLGQSLVTKLLADN